MEHIKYDGDCAKKDEENGDGEILPINAKMTPDLRPLVERKEYLPLPKWLTNDYKSNVAELEGWKCVEIARADGSGRKDKYYTHKDYAHTFRSKKEVQHFLDTREVKGKGLLQKKLADDPSGQSSGARRSTKRTMSLPANNDPPKRPIDGFSSNAKGEWYALSAGGNFTPHVVIVGTGEDVAARIMSFSQKGPRSVCILSANGTISNVTLRQPDASGSTFIYEGRFEILQLMGSFTMAEEGRRRTGGLSVSLACPDGRVVGGVVAGMMRAASPIQVIVGSFLPNSLKQHQRRMSMQQQPSPVPALPAPVAPPPVLTAATPISQAGPGNGFNAPPPSAAPPQPHANTMNPNATTGFTMVGWPASSPQPIAYRASPDSNVSLTPQE